MPDEQSEHIPHVKDDQESPYWSIRCSCRWKSGVCTELDAAVEAYGEHMRTVGGANTTVEVKRRRGLPTTDCF